MAIEFIGEDAANSKLTTITSGTAGVKGSYVELVASTARASKLITLQVHGISADDSFEIFVAIGAASSEVDQFALNFWGNLEGSRANMPPIPFSIASGVRVAIAVLSNNASSTCGVGVSLSDDDSFGTGSEATLVGSSGGLGVTVDPGGTADTKGSWVEIVSSAPHDMDYLVVCIGENGNDTIGNVYEFLIDIGLGAASSEVALVEDIYNSHFAPERGNGWFPIYAPVSSGDRISARCQSSDISDATDRLIDVSVLGVNITAPSGGGVAQALAY